MYSVSQFEDRHFMACSVPPPVNPNLEKGFQELSRIHFYLGHAPIDFMIEAVERASLTDIEKGKIPIYFAVKEIQDFLSSSGASISAFGTDKFEPGLYFNQTFESLLKQTIKVLDKSFKSPTKKSNFAAITTMVGLTHEVMFLQANLKENGIETNSIDDMVSSIKQKYEKIFALKGHYQNLESLPEFDSYAEGAKKSVICQLSQPYEFNYADLTKIYFNDNKWIYLLHDILEKQKEIDTNPDYKFNSFEAQELKDNFLKQIKSFNRLFKNGVVNYVLTYAAAISKESWLNVQKSQVSAQAYFDKEIGYHKDSLVKNHSSRSCKYHEEKIAALEKIKDKYIQTKIDDKAFYEEYLTVLHRQEANILQGLNKLRIKHSNVKPKDTLTFEGDIKTGFVVGKFSNSENIMLIHKDTTVDVPEAVFAMILNKDRYEQLVKDDKLIFDVNFKEKHAITGSNFWSYGQLLQELSESRVQKFFLGQEFDLMDKTVIPEIKKPKFV